MRDNSRRAEPRQDLLDHEPGQRPLRAAGTARANWTGKNLAGTNMEANLRIEGALRAGVATLNLGFLNPLVNMILELT